jgi:NTE family protein
MTRRCVWRACAGVVLPVLLAAPCVAGQASPGGTRNGAAGAVPRVAIVLSGGGAKGLAHIGVLRVLEEAGLSPQIVTGTSMGALVGGLYAIGYSPSSLDSIARALDWNSYFSDATDHRLLEIDRRLAPEKTLISVPMKRWRPSLPSGAVSGQRISRLLSRLTWRAQSERDFSRLPREFVAIGTDIESGAPVQLHRGSLADALRASMSLPSVFEPVAVDGRLLVDGGIARNLPAAEARELGATIVICSDVADRLATGAQLTSLTDVLLQTIAFQMNASTLEQRKLCDIYIRPDITGFSATDFSNPAGLIARGVAAADSLRSQLDQLVARLPAVEQMPLHSLVWADSVYAARIEIEGLTGRAAERARRALELGRARWVSASALDSATQRAYATGLYERVRYRVDANVGDTAVIVTVTPRTRDRAGFGFRFDDTYKAALLFTGQVRNWLGSGSTTDTELRLGEQLKLSVDHLSTSVQNPRFAFGLGAAAIRTPLPIYAGTQRVAEVTLSVAQLRSFLGAKLGRHGGLAIEVGAERANAATSIAVTDSTRRDAIATVGVVLAWDALDQPVYPRRGIAATWRAHQARGTTQFSQQIVRGRWAQPLTRQLVLNGDGALGIATRGAALPTHRYFQLGGAYAAVLFDDRQVAFAGLRPAEQLGTSLIKSALGLQYELRPNTYVTARVNSGYAGDLLTLDETRYRSSLALSAGSLTPFGLVELTAAADDRRGRTRVELNIGRAF